MCFKQFVNLGDSGDLIFSEYQSLILLPPLLKLSPTHFFLKKKMGIYIFLNFIKSISHYCLGNRCRFYCIILYTHYVYVDTLLFFIIQIDTSNFFFRKVIMRIDPLNYKFNLSVNVPY